MEQVPLTSRALRHLLDRDHHLSRQVAQDLRPVSLILPPVAGERTPWPVPPEPVTEDALLELLRWRVEAQAGHSEPVTVHDLLRGALTTEGAARVAGLTPHVQGLRDRYRQQQTFTPEDLSVTLRWAEQALGTAEPMTVKSLRKRGQHLAWLLAAPWPEALLTAPVQARPTVGDLQVNGMPVFVRVACGQKVEPVWRSVLGAAALAAAHQGQDPQAVRVGLWSVPHATLLDVRLGELFPAPYLPKLIQVFGQQVTQTDWLALGRTRRPAPLPGKATQTLHPLLALQAVNSRTKAIARELQGQPHRRDALELRREQTYLYELKSRAAQVLLDLGMLRPVAIDREALLVVGRTPLGPRGFHLPLERFEPYVARIDGQRKGQAGRIEDAEAVLAHIDQARAVALLTRLIARKRLD
ncbi:hypothetical protein [Deinococcus multiflagellatus]|uniref:Uncharacterized protein n=1 Tax=Deinococcus multiflagellatus TaxID=1656887 RepID=A0ABW1ZTN9_9DEIO|nr:hypothetical protein [Deinococcus multiflagellatus]MBZ9716132.1 hypothetical protein [Deinococcus multiflagellatus]